MSYNLKDKLSIINPEEEIDVAIYNIDIDNKKVTLIIPSEIGRIKRKEKNQMTNTKRDVNFNQKNNRDENWKSSILELKVGQKINGKIKYVTTSGYVRRTRMWS